MMEKYIPLSCDYYEFFELACLYRYELKLSLSDEQVVKGVADTLVIHPDDKSEWLRLVTPGLQLDVRLDYISKVEVLTENTQYSVIDIHPLTSCTR